MSRPMWTVVAVLLCGLAGPAVSPAGAASVQRDGRHHGHHISRRPAVAGGRGSVLGLGSGERALHGSTAVRRLQRGLRRAGYAPGPADGRYGPRTTNAVRAFQRNHGLRATGSVDPATRAVMRAPARLRVGSGVWSAHGSRAVAALQARLRRAGDSPGPIDGRFGPRTLRALLAFQGAHGLPRSGVAGPATERALEPRPTVARQRVTAERRRRTPPAPSTRLLTHAPRATGARDTNRSVPPLPVGWIIAALALLGAGAVVRGYARTRRQMRRGAPPSPVPHGGLRR